MNALPLLAPAASFASHLQAPGVLLLDVREPDAYAAGHLPGALNLPYALYVHARPPAMGALPPLSALSAALGAVGYQPERTVLAYDEGGSGKAARLLWTLACVGHHEMAMLDGGLAWWLDHIGIDLVREQPPVTPSQPQLSWAEGVHADRDWVAAHLGDADVTLLDARSPAEFAGVDVRAARGGHIPGAINLDWVTAFDPARLPCVKPLDTLRAQFLAAGIDPAHEIVAYCQTHHRSALSWVLLKTLGYARVRGYAGAWSEWGNTPGLPVEP